MPNVFDIDSSYGLYERFEGKLFDNSLRITECNPKRLVLKRDDYLKVDELKLTEHTIAELQKIMKPLQIPLLRSYCDVFLGDYAMERDWEGLIIETNRVFSIVSEHAYKKIENLEIRSKGDVMIAYESLCLENVKISCSRLLINDASPLEGNFKINAGDVWSHGPKVGKILKEGIISEDDHYRYVSKECMEEACKVQGIEYRDKICAWVDDDASYYRSVREA